MTHILVPQKEGTTAIFSNKQEFKIDLQTAFAPVH